MTNYTIGIDIGGSSIKGALVGRNGQIFKSIVLETPRKDRRKLIQTILFAVSFLMPNKKVKIGLAVAGQIDSRKGVIIQSPNLAYCKNFPIVRFLEQKNCSISAINNDANCFVLAENHFGAGKGLKNVVGLTLGTGIGGGLIIEKKLYLGSSFATEPGHMTVCYQGRTCTCGKKGHLEGYASGRAIEKQYYLKTGHKKDALEIEKEALADPKSKAKEIYLEAVDYLSVGLASLIDILDPEMIILGGSLGLKSKIIFKQVSFKLKKTLFLQKTKCKIRQGRLGEMAGVIGASILAKKPTSRLV